MFAVMIAANSPGASVSWLVSLLVTTGMLSWGVGVVVARLPGGVK